MLVVATGWTMGGCSFLDVVVGGHNWRNAVGLRDRRS